MFTKDLSWDKDATHTDDLGTFLPLKGLNALAAKGTIGSASDRFYGVPTEYSKRRTLADAERVLTWAREDDVGRDASGAPLTRLSPDRESDRTPSRSKRNRHCGSG